jgi:hypothetical protein
MSPLRCSIGCGSRQVENKSSLMADTIRLVCFGSPRAWVRSVRAESIVAQGWTTGKRGFCGSLKM